MTGWTPLRACRQIPAFVCILGLCVLSGRTARADRAILSPRGFILSPGDVQFEYAGRTTDGHSNVQWLQVSMPGSDLGLELELERRQASGRSRSSFNLEYTLTGNALSDIAPVIAVGARDLINSDVEGRSAYLALSKTIGLSLAQSRVVSDLKVHAGYGSGRMDGLFASGELRFRLGFTVSAEYFQQRWNMEVAVPASKYLKLRAYTLNGAVYYGASLRIAR
ncbi:MAG: hypothetical protein ACP5VE_00475 [Chthonomonadales bacterium]